MRVGQISKLFPEQEFGLIRAKSGEEVHFHKNCLWNMRFDELTDGLEVEFEMQETHKGYLGFHIRPHNSL